ncbi:MAG: hypothetical protein L6305_05550 [Actinomycetia bacterium]|nr:hypothetical protein [Actinomycetes bacterium]
MKLKYGASILAVVIIVLIAMISCISCNAEPVKECPEDLTVTFYWTTPPLSPEYNYYYGITIGPGLQGLFEYQPGYPDTSWEPLSPDVWEVSFEVSQDQADHLYQLLIENSLFKRRWEKTDEVAIGGGSSSIKIIANGKKYDKIPGDSEIKPEDRKKVDKVSGYLKEMVPTNIWQEMEERQNQFEKSYIDE